MPAANIIFMDGFDTYGTASNISDKWYVTGVSNMDIVAGRYGGNSLKITSSATAKVFFVNNQFSCVSFALHTGLPSAVRVICTLFDAADTQVDIRINTNGTIAWTRGGTTTLATSTSSIQANCWNYFEWKVMIANSITANSCQLKVNGELFINLAATTDTQNNANAYANTLQIQSDTNTATFPYFDDFILQVGSGSDFLNDTTIITTLPTGNGDASDFTGSDSNSTNNYLLVDDTTPDDDATYVESSTVGNKDLYTYPSLGITANSVVAVAVDINCKKTDSAIRTLCSVVKSGSTEQDGNSTYISDSYFYQIQSILPTNPATSSAWTQGEAEAAQVGQKVLS